MSDIGDVSPDREGREMSAPIETPKPAAREGELTTRPEEETANQANQRLLHLFSKVLIPSLAIILLLLVLAFIAMFFFVTRVPVGHQIGDIYYPPDPADPELRELVVHLVQVGIGMTLGFLCLFLGAVMCWFGITGAFTVGAESSAGKLQVQGTHVGLVLLVGGILLSAMTLQKSTGREATKATQSAVLIPRPYDVKTGLPIEDPLMRHTTPASQGPPMERPSVPPADPRGTSPPPER